MGSAERWREAEHANDADPRLDDLVRRVRESSKHAQVTPSLIPCVHDAHARGPHFLELGSHFCMEPLVLESETGRADHSLDPLFVL